MKTPEHCAKSVQSQQKNTRTTSLTDFTHRSGVLIVHIEQVKVCRDI